MANLFPRDISISNEQALLIQERLRSIGVKKVLEIGSFQGFSACKIREALPEDGHVISIEKDQENFKIASQRAQYYTNIKFLCGDALEVLPTLKGKKFDAVFIDANKARYYDYLEMSYPLLRQGGLIIADNVLFRGFVLSENYPGRKNVIASPCNGRGNPEKKFVNWIASSSFAKTHRNDDTTPTIPKRYKNIVKGLRKFIEAISDKTRFDTTILEVGDGMSFSYKI